MERVVDDWDRCQERVVAHGVLEGLVHVHGEQTDAPLLIFGQGVELLLERFLTSTVAEGDGLPGLEVADDGDVLLGPFVASPEVLLVDADVAEFDLGALCLPPGDGGTFRAPYRRPAQAVLRRDPDGRRRRRLQGKVLLQPSRLALVGLGPRQCLHGRGVAALAGDPLRRVLDEHGMPRPGQVVPPAGLLGAVLLGADLPAVDTTSSRKAPLQPKHQPHIRWQKVLAHGPDTLAP